MGWNVQITLNAKTGKGSTDLLAADVRSEKDVPQVAEDAQLGSGLWLYAADDDEADVFEDFALPPQTATSQAKA